MSEKPGSDVDMLVSRVLCLIEGKAGTFKSTPPEEAARQLGAAGLMRCCALVRGIGHLESVNLSTITPVLVRLHWETWLVSIYVLLGGKIAMDDLEADDVHWKRILNDKLELQLPYPKSEWEGKPHKLKISELSEKIKPLLLKAGEPDVPQGTSAYDATYRVQSTFGGHANLHSLLLHIEFGDGEWAINPQPVCPFSRCANTCHQHGTFGEICVQSFRSAIRHDRGDGRKGTRLVMRPARAFRVAWLWRRRKPFSLAIFLT